MLRLHHRFVFFVFIISFFFCYSVYAYTVGEKIIGYEYNEILKHLIKKKFSIGVDVDENHKEFIYFEGETGLGYATVEVPYSKKIKRRLKKVINKFFEWSEIARKNKVNVEKGLGCFGSNKSYRACQKLGYAVSKNQMGLRFFSDKNGKLIGVIITLIDKYNEYKKACILITDPSEMKKLLNNLDKIDSVLKKAHEEIRNKKLFK